MLAALAFVAAVSPEVQAQFNPGGRKKPPRAQPARPASPPRAAPSGSKPRPATPSAQPAKPSGSDDDAGAAKEGPGRDALIARYTGVVLAQPGATFPLQRLAQLYRERDGNLQQLLAEFEKRAEAPGPERFHALIALAGLYRQDAQPERAMATYERALAEQPKSALALLAVAAVLNERGDKAAALQRYEQALPLIKDDAEREQTLRVVLQLALDQKDYERAKNFHKQLVERAKGSFFVRGELGRELLQRGEYARAEEEFRQVVRAAQGDNRVLAPALRDLGRALVKQGKREAGLVELRRALAIAGAQAGIRREIYDIIVEAYRADEKLTELVAELEKTPSDDYDRLRLLGSLYEETGKIEAARTTYERALRKNPKDLETRLKLVQLLQLEGNLDRAIAEYRQLIRVAPQNPDFVFQLAEALLQRGERAAALEQLKQLEARSSDQEETLAALVDFYERMDEKPRALALLSRLSQLGSRDPHHLVELGARYWQQDDKKKAVQTWERIRLVVPDRALALHTLGEVYLEHDMSTEALEALREAVKLRPSELKYKKAYAVALERTGAASTNREYRARQYDDARKIWEELLQAAGSNAHAAREARQHIVTLWALGGELPQRVPPLTRKFQGKPPDLEAGRLLAEVQIKLRRFADAERTLEAVVRHAPGDAASLVQLERVLVQQRKLARAIEVLEKLVHADPKRARESYQRMAQYAAELYRDDDALRFAARAVELGPDDAEGHRKLGEMYRQRQDNARAIAAFRQAIAKNDRLFPVYFQLAELLINRGDLQEADQLLRRVLRSSPDEELISQAARLSMQINIGQGTLESLEKELLPLSLAHVKRPVYRRLLVEIYGALAFPLVQQSKSSDPEEAARARAQLARIGERAVKPLLDALGDERDVQQRIAIELLGHIQNPSAGPALVAFATGGAESELRVRAMVSAGSLADRELVPRLAAVLAPRGRAVSDESDPVAVAAAFSVARLRTREAEPLLVSLLASDAPSIRAFGALGLGLLREGRHVKRLAELAGSAEVGPLPRAAAAFALGELGAKGEHGVLSQLSQSPDEHVQATAVLALARLGAPDAPTRIAEALVSPEPAVQEAAAAAAVVASSGEYRVPPQAFESLDHQVDVRTVLARLRPRGYTDAERARAFIALAPALRRVVAAAVQSSPERARAIARALTAAPGEVGFGELSAPRAGLPAALSREVEEATLGLARAALPGFLRLAEHPSPEVRADAAAFLARRPEPEARRALVAAVHDSDPDVQRSALSGLSSADAALAAPEVLSLLERDTAWPVRLRAVETLGALGGVQGKAAADVARALVRVAQNDAFALVREAALRSLSQVAPAAARPVLARSTTADPEPRVRQTAATMLRELK